MTELLYRIEWGPPQVHYFDPDIEEPPDLYPFQVSSLPDDVAAEAEQSRLGGSPFAINDLIDRGISKVNWRQYPTEILEHQAATTEIFDSLTRLTEGRIFARSKIDIRFAGSIDGYTTYHLVSHTEPEQDPFYNSTDLARTPHLADASDMSEVSRRKRTLWRERTSITLWLPKSLLEQPQSMCIGALDRSHVLVNEQFVRAWRATDVSQRLREHPWEFDLHFDPLTLPGHDYKFFDD